MSQINRKIKSSVFTDLFQNCSHAKEYALELYNGIEGTNISDPKRIEHIEIDDSIYRSIKNDVSFMVDGKLMILVEHQSTINPNMPLRSLMYMGRLYEKVVEKTLRYRKTLVKIPEPEIYVFYNGKEPYPRESTLFLSDAFLVKKNEIPIEVKVKVYNIRPKGNDNSSETTDHIDILERCPILKEYCEFIEEYELCKEKGYENPARIAIENCIKRNVLKEYLTEAGDEVMSFLTAEYDYDMDIKVNREEAFEAGVEQNTIKNIISIMKSLDFDIDKAMDCLEIPVEKREQYKELIKAKY